MVKSEFPVTIEKLLTLPQLKCIRVVAGKGGLGREVAWANTLESSKLIGFVHEHELIFTTGINAQDRKDGLYRIVKGVCEVGAAGIVINLGPYIHEVRPDIIEYAEKNNFPVLTLPWEIRIADTTHAIYEYIIKGVGEKNKINGLLRELIFGLGQEPVDLHVLEQYGYRDDHSYCVLICDVPDCSDQDKSTISMAISNKFLSMNLRSIYLEENNHLIFVLQKNDVHNQDVGNVVDMTVKDLNLDRDQTRFFVGVGQYYHSLANLGTSYKEALRVINVMKNNPRRSTRIFTFEELGIYKLFAGLGEHDEVRAFSRQVLGKLEEYDRINATDYLDFLRLYLEENGSLAKISQLLFMHRNTVMYKINKIEKILGCDLSLVRDKTDIMVSFIIRDTL